MPQEQEIHQMVVGDRAHRIVAEVLHEGVQSERHARTLQITRHAKAIFQDNPVSYRPREALFDAVTAAGVYLHRFLPLTPWKVSGIEVQSGQSRLHLTFCNGGVGNLIDEMKLGVGRYGESAVREQIDRHLEIGQHRWGSSFLGVRLCAIHEPHQSRLHSPGGTSQLVAESELSEELWVR